jgi:hypothetical protein
MNRKTFQALIWLMWLSLPLTAFRYLQVWNQLPLRMATHFNLNWQPNGWMPRETALWLALGTATFMLVVFTVVSYIAHRSHVPDAVSWALLGFSYLVIGFLYALNSGVVQYNLDGRAFHIDSWTVMLSVGVVAFTAIFLGTKRGDSLPDETVIAEETQASRVWSLLFIALLVAQISIAIAIPQPSLRIASIPLCLLFAAIAFHTWSGFHYLFTNAGVEISTLGFRLRSIPRADIKHYDVESWNLLRGYGIRGVGNSRAYVWCNQGVRIQTTNGEVFLGHEEPERIIQDLDSVTLGHARG